MRVFCSLLISVLVSSSAPLVGQEKEVASRIYHDRWIDLNKNGRMDIYENPAASIERRIEDLLSQMNLAEKTCQTATLYGYKRVLQDELPTPTWKNEIWKDGIANIDEHLNGWAAGSASVFANDIRKHVWAMNETQRFFVEDTRLGIPVDFTNEGLRGVAFPIATSFPSEFFTREGRLLLYSELSHGAFANAHEDL